jgi:hypothetical protein
LHDTPIISPPSLVLYEPLLDAGPLHHTAVAERAAEAYEDPNLVDVPKVKDEGLGVSGGGGSSFDMGRAVTEPVLQFSAAYEGLCLISARLLKPVWEQPVVVDRGRVLGFSVLTLGPRQGGCGRKVVWSKAS